MEEEEKGPQELSEEDLDAVAGGLIIGVNSLAEIEPATAKIGTESLSAAYQAKPGN